MDSLDKSLRKLTEEGQSNFVTPILKLSGSDNNGKAQILI